MYMYIEKHATRTIHAIRKEGKSASGCNTLQHAATRCNTLQHAATRQHTAPYTERPDITIVVTEGRVCLSFDRVSLQHLVCRCIVLHRSLLVKNPQETWSQLFKLSISTSMLNEFATLLQHLALVWSNDFWTFLGLFCMNPWKLNQSVDWRTDTREFSRWIFSTLQNLVDWRTDTTLTHHMAENDSSYGCN